MVKEADSDDNHSISFDEFCKAIEKIDVERKFSIRHLN
jgi:Ca2+-binding EF-hand superfamily protein